MHKNHIRNFILFMLLFICVIGKAQDSAKISIDQKRMDKSYIKNPFKEVFNTCIKSVKLKYDKSFTNFSNNEVYVFAGMNLSKQTINEQSYHSSFNYKLEDINKNVFNPGYFMGARVDGKFKSKHLYSFIFGLNKYSTGTSYQNRKTIDPFIGAFTNFKADQQLLTLNLAAHYKYNIVLGDTSKRKLYLIAGPSVDIRLSNQSIDNQINQIYKPLFLKADIGVEFDNHSYYTLFLHYKQGVNSLTKSPINNNMNSIELGMLIKASDLF